MKKIKTNKKNIKVKVSPLSVEQVDGILTAADDVVKKLRRMAKDEFVLTEKVEMRLKGMKLFAYNVLIQYFNNSVQEIHKDIRKEITKDIIKEKSEAKVVAKKVKKVTKKKKNGKN